VTKPFTATAIMMLAEEGKITLDERMHATCLNCLPIGVQSRSGRHSHTRRG
jgi:hypothetical protein